MAYAIAAVRTAVLALLDDVSSARFTSAQIDQAVRQALLDYTLYRPVVRTYEFETDGYQTMPLPADFEAIRISKVELWDDDPKRIRKIKFHAYKVDEQWLLETVDETFEALEILTITYSAKHTVDGLDSAAGTTIDDDNLLCMGAAGYAAQSRATSRAESINMQAEVMIQLLTISSRYMTAFIEQLKRGQSAPVYGSLDMPHVGF
jgi:hypothetical protein